MSKRTTFTTISPLPHGISRETVIDFLHEYTEMIDLNPLVKERHRIKAPPHASPEEFHCTWYSLTDKISWLPGGLASGDVTYTCAFHDLPNGLQTHCFAPARLNIREKWTLNGSLPGEPVEPVELGIGAPLTGLYIREDVDMTCNFVMTGFVKKTLKKSHAALVERLKVKAQLAAVTEHNSRLAASSQSSARSGIRGKSTLAMPVSPPTPGSMDNARSEVSPPVQSPRYDPAATRGVQRRLGGLMPSQSRLPADSRDQPRHQQQPYFPPPPTQSSQKPSPLFLSPRKPSSFPPSPSHPQQPSPPLSKPSLPHPQSANLYPSPPRLRSVSTTSTSSTTSSSSTASNPAYRDVQERVTWSSLKPSGTIRYCPHPDYGHMNPYSDESEAGAPRPIGSISADSPVLGFEYPATKQYTQATLSGPFVAEMEG
ncbi:hypothetical protein DL546_008659 [Coniochaeta pulveracea]|uniref:DUF7053 domain-containing protein n=1 Tax=Coniochaeta pulveracea TaxID=177199 RepID=A0A420YH75_9PEZI|nr:hypothetical protein DL546_008659 [Coniochaeta pulveracea]